MPYAVHISENFYCADSSCLVDSLSTSHQKEKMGRTTEDVDTNALNYLVHLATDTYYRTKAEDHEAYLTKLEEAIEKGNEILKSGFIPEIKNRRMKTEKVREGNEEECCYPILQGLKTLVRFLKYTFSKRRFIKQLEIVKGHLCVRMMLTIRT